MIHIIVALQCEARPLISYYNLKSLPKDNDFRVYHGNDIILTVSGVGKIVVAAAVRYTHALSMSRFNRSKLLHRFDRIQNIRSHAAWINVGIAGHAHWLLGQGVLASKITDASEARDWCPSLLFEPLCRTGHVITVENVENSYPNDAVYDMEASGFYRAASLFASAELVHCYKIISDNRSSPVERISGRTVAELIERNIAEIDSIVGKLGKRVASP